MATIANWNGHTFEVSASLIRCFDDLTIKGSCETEDKKKSKKGYVKRKKGQPREITFNLPLSALLGVTDVRSEALAYVNEAYDGKTGYFYIGTKKLFNSKVMLTNAEISEVITMPGEGQTWVGCTVKLTFKQSSKDSGSSGSKKKKSARKSHRSGSGGSRSGGSRSGGSRSGGSGSKKDRLKGGTTTEVDAITGADPSITIATAKAASKSKLPGVGFLSKLAVAKKTQTTRDTSTKTSATTGRKIGSQVVMYAGKK